MAVAGCGAASGFGMEFHKGADMVLAEFARLEFGYTHFGEGKAQIGRRSGRREDGHHRRRGAMNASPHSFSVALARIAKSRMATELPARR